jgi:hypothetical protein
MKKYMILLSLLSCAAIPPSKFTPKDKTLFGYEITQHPEDPQYQQATFEGNEETSPMAALAYSYLAAISTCKKTDKIAVTMVPEDQSKFPNPKYAANFICVSGVKAFGELEKLQDSKDGVIIQELNTLEETPFERNDILLSINGKKIEEQTQISYVLASIQDPRPKVAILRGYKVMTLTPKTASITVTYKMYEDGMIKALCEKLTHEEKPQDCKR